MCKRKQKRGVRDTERAYIAMLRDREVERTMVQWFCGWRECEWFGKGVIGYV